MPRPTSAPTSPDYRGAGRRVQKDRAERPHGHHGADDRDRPGQDAQAHEGTSARADHGAGREPLLGHRLARLFGDDLALLVAGYHSNSIVREPGALEFEDRLLGGGAGLENANHRIASCHHVAPLGEPDRSSGWAHRGCAFPVPPQSWIQGRGLGAKKNPAAQGCAAGFPDGENDQKSDLYFSDNLRRVSTSVRSICDHASRRRFWSSAITLAIFAWISGMFVSTWDGPKTNGCQPHQPPGTMPIDGRDE